MNFRKDPNIGLYALATDKYALLPRFLKRKELRKTKKVLKTRLIQASVHGLDFLGIFLVGNSQGLLIPKIADEGEVKLNCLQLKTKFSALGNLVVCNDNGCLVSPYLEKRAKQIQKFLKVPVKVATIGGSRIIGSQCIATNKGFIATPRITDKEFKLFENVLQVKGDVGTVNLGSFFVKSALIANSNGFLVSEATRGPEIARIDEALGFL